MGVKAGNLVSDEYTMSSGNGQLSYTKNSTYQGRVIEVTKPLIYEIIPKALDKELLISTTLFNIADLGCSIGPNTFISVHNIIQAVNKSKHQIPQQAINPSPEFQVFFSDHTSNDFNTLFKSLPPNREYYSSGVPGSFYSRLFPHNSIHVVHSSFALHWLSKVPADVAEKASAAWNRGRIEYTNASEEVQEAYSRQHGKDMDCFLSERAKELVPGGLMVIVVPSRVNGVLHSQILFNLLNDILGSCLMDLAKRGVVEEELIDAFNLPMYITSTEELEAAITKNGSFSIETMQILPSVSTTDAGLNPKGTSTGIRAIMEGIITDNFGSGILDELFDLFTHKLEEDYDNVVAAKVFNTFLVLKRKSDN